MQVKTRQHNSGKIFDENGNFKIELLDFSKFFPLYLLCAFLIQFLIFSGIFDFILGVVISALIYIIFQHYRQSPYNFIHSKTHDRYINANFFHHQKYYNNPELIQHAQKSIWKEYYQLPFLYKAYGILGGSTLLLIYIAGIMDGISKNISVFTNIIVMLATFGQLFLAFVLIFFLRRKYTDKLKNPGNRYLLGNIDTKRYSISRKVNKQGLNDYILEKI